MNLKKDRIMAGVQMYFCFEQKYYKKLVKGHSYNVIKLKHYKNEILFNIRNLWTHENKFWTGRWSEERKEEWTDEAIKFLDP